MSHSELYRPVKWNLQTREILNENIWQREFDLLKDSQLKLKKQQ